MSDTTLQRLLRYPHTAVFDTDPGAELAMRVRHASGATWTVADDVLTVRAGTAVPLTFNLGSMTVGQLAAALTSAGFQVEALSSAWASRSAMVLVEGSGDQGQSNGDHLTAFTSLLWGLNSSYAAELRAAQEQIANALRQMVIPQAEGEWLDLWGTLYGLERKASELDADYAPRIPKETFRERVNAHAIELAIRDETGWDVRIEEPWRELFRLDESRLSGGDRFYDGDHIGYHLIRPEALDNDVDWNVVLPIIDRNKPAGVIVVDWHVKPTRIHQDVVRYTSREWRGSRRSWMSAQSTWQGLNPLIDSQITGPLLLDGSWNLSGDQMIDGLRRAEARTLDGSWTLGQGLTLNGILI